MQQQCNSSGGGGGSKRSCSMEAHGGAVTMMQCSCGGLVDPGPFPIFFANGGIHEQQHRSSDVDANRPPLGVSSPPFSAVDCTLSLGTPSTRRQQPSAAASSKPSSSSAAAAAKHRNSFPLRFDFFRADQPKNSMAGGDRVLLPRRCASCDTTSTPLWRNGPRGPKSLCNACGIRYKKEERRAASAAGNSSTPSPSSSCFVSSPAALMDALPPPAAPQYLMTSYGGHHHPWGYPAARLAAAPRKCPSSAILSAIALDENVDPTVAAATAAAAVPYP